MSISLFFSVAFFYLRYTKPVYESGLIAQLENTDNAKDVLDITNLNNVDAIFRSNIELLTAPVSFRERSEENEP